MGKILSTETATPKPENIFETRPTAVTPLPVQWPVEAIFPRELYLGRARNSRPSDRVAFLIHGLAMNEDYFGLLVPELIDRGYDVWALRLPGYVGSDETPGTLSTLHGQPTPRWRLLPRHRR